MRKKIEIYFLLYLTAIMSFFVVENQVRVYKQKTSHLIASLVFEVGGISVTSPSIYAVGDTVTVQLYLAGEYDPASVAGTVEFFRKSDSAVVAESPLRPAPGMAGTFVAKTYVRPEVFPEQIDHGVRVNGSVKLSINDSTRARWARMLRDPKLVKELEGRLSTRQMAGKQFAEYLPLSYSREKVEERAPASQFVLVPSEPRLFILQGVPWETSVFIGGVAAPGDYDVSLTEGRKEYNAVIIKGVPNIRLKGQGTSSATIGLTARHRLTGSSTSATITVTARPPKFVSESKAQDAYIGDSYTFDGRLEGIDASKIRIEAKGMIQKSFAGAYAEIPQLSAPGTISFEVYAFNAKVRDFLLTVKETPAPVIEFDRRQGNAMILRVKSFGKVKGEPNSSKLIAISGVQSISQLAEQTIETTTITTYQVNLRSVDAGLQRFEVKARDKRQRESKVFVREVTK